MRLCCRQPWVRIYHDPDLMASKFHFGNFVPPDSLESMNFETIFQRIFMFSSGLDLLTNKMYPKSLEIKTEKQIIDTLPRGWVRRRFPSVFWTLCSNKSGIVWTQWTLEGRAHCLVPWKQPLSWASALRSSPHDGRTMQPLSSATHWGGWCVVCRASLLQHKPRLFTEGNVSVLSNMFFSGCTFFFTFYFQPLPGRRSCFMFYQLQVHQYDFPEQEGVRCSRLAGCLAE